MPRAQARVLALAIVLLVTVAGGAGGTTVRADGVAAIRAVDDLVIGESDQTFRALRIAGFDEGAETLEVEVDVSVLKRHGVDLSEAGVSVPPDEEIDGASVRSATVSDGVISLVLVPSDSGIFVPKFRLTGLETTDASVTTDLSYEVSFSAGDGNEPSFDIIDADAVNPRASVEELVLADGTQWVTIERIQPANETTVVELDATVLREYGVGLEQLEVEARSEEGTVERTSVNDGQVRVVVSPNEDTVLFDIELLLTGFDTSAVDADERTIATGLSYGIRLDGVAKETLEDDTFPLLRDFPSPHVDSTASVTPEDPRGSAATGTPSQHGTEPWPAFALVGLVAIAVLAHRRGLGPGGED